MDDQGLLQYDVAYPARLSRLLIFIKGFLLIPHLIVLSILGIGLYFVTFLAWWAILFTGNYPRGLFDFSLMVLRWQARVAAYYMLQRDEYPPFGDDASYPVHLSLGYPTRLSRILIFVKWLLIIPHWIVFYVLGLAWYVAIFVAWWAILITGKYPRGLFDFVTGVTRWYYRLLAYVLLLTDHYPPFGLGGTPAPAGYGPETAPAPVQF